MVSSALIAAGFNAIDRRLPKSGLRNIELRLYALLNKETL